MNNTIPPITDPMSRSWRQPASSSILIDDTHALLTPGAFSSLSEYSSSMPSGVYPGKMWKRHDGAFDRHCKPEDRQWLLVWYGECDDPKLCSINRRIILLSEGQLP